MTTTAPLFSQIAFRDELLTFLSRVSEWVDHDEFRRGMPSAMCNARREELMVAIAGAKE